MMRRIGFVMLLANVGLGGCGLTGEGVLTDGEGDASDGHALEAGAGSLPVDATKHHDSGDTTAKPDARHDATEKDVVTPGTDAGTPDAISHEAGQPDATGGDTGALDASPHDAGHADVGLHDAGHPDADRVDARIVDARSDTRDVSVVSPETCAALDLPPGQQTVTLYLNGDPSMPWTAVCVTTATSSQSFLPLPTGNQSAYPLGVCATAVGTEPGVVTTYSMILFDPTTLLVDTSNMTGATSTGATFETSGNNTVHHQYNSMPFASARTCLNKAPAAVGTINLTATHFVLDPSQTFTVQGSAATGSGTTVGEMTTLSVEGYPAGISPCSSVTDYYTDVGGTCLKLAYSP